MPDCTAMMDGDVIMSACVSLGGVPADMLLPDMEMDDAMSVADCLRGGVPGRPSTVDADGISGAVALYDDRDPASLFKSTNKSEYNKNVEIICDIWTSLLIA